MEKDEIARIFCAGPKFMERLKECRDNKLLNLPKLRKGASKFGPERDCSLYQCCHEMVNQGVLISAWEKGAR
jgi:hypothetical protein